MSDKIKEGDIRVIGKKAYVALKVEKGKGPCEKCSLTNKPNKCDDVPCSNYKNGYVFQNFRWKKIGKVTKEKVLTLETVA